MYITKEYCEQIQVNIEKLSKKTVIIRGIVLAIISLLCLIFSRWQIEKAYFVIGIDLVFKYHLPLASSILIIHVLLLAMLILNKSNDGMRYATTFSLFNVFLFFLLGIWEIPGKFTYVEANPEGQGVLAAFGVIASTINVLILGVTSSKSEPISKAFKYYANLCYKLRKYNDNSFMKWKEKRKNNLMGSKVDSFVVGLLCTIFFIAILIIIFWPEGTSGEKYLQICIAFVVTIFLLVLYLRKKY